MPALVEISQAALPKDSHFSEAWITDVVIGTLKKVKYNRGALSIALVTKSIIQDANRIYRRKDKPTDVLAFSFGEDHVEREQGMYWGEIVLCPAMARKNIPAFGLPYKKEIARLLIHGTLHLAGYDHVKADEAKIMFRLTDIVLKSVRV